VERGQEFRGAVKAKGGDLQRRHQTRNLGIDGKRNLNLKTHMPLTQSRSSSVLVLLGRAYRSKGGRGGDHCVPVRGFLFDDVIVTRKKRLAMRAGYP